MHIITQRKGKLSISACMASRASLGSTSQPFNVVILGIHILPTCDVSRQWSSLLTISHDVKFKCAALHRVHFWWYTCHFSAYIAPLHLSWSSYVDLCGKIWSLEIPVSCKTVIDSPILTIELLASVTFCASEMKNHLCQVTSDEDTIIPGWHLFSEFVSSRKTRCAS